MATRISRRGILAGSVAAPLAALPAAASPRAGGTFQTGFFAIPEGGNALIGLLLPAVQRAREAARLQLLSLTGEVLFSVPVPDGRPGLFRLEMQYDASAGPVLALTHERSSRIWRAPFAGGPLYGLLLPAVRSDGRPGGLLGGSIQILSDGELAEILPFSPIGVPGPDEAGAAFLGPVLIAADAPALIGLLLPAVQRPREAARVVLTNGAGEPFVDERLPSQGKAPIGYRLEIIFTLGVFGVQLIFQDGSVRSVGRGVSADGLLLGLALPAVQADGSPAGLLGASARIPTPRHQDGVNIVFADGHSKWFP